MLMYSGVVLSCTLKLSRRENSSLWNRRIHPGCVEGGTSKEETRKEKEGREGLGWLAGEGGWKGGTEPRRKSFLPTIPASGAP